MYTNTQKIIENKKITFLENVRKIYQLKVTDPLNNYDRNSITETITLTNILLGWLSFEILSSRKRLFFHRKISNSFNILLYKKVHLHLSIRFWDSRETEQNFYHSSNTTFVNISQFSNAFYIYDLSLVLRIIYKCRDIRCQ